MDDSRYDLIVIGGGPAGSAGALAAAAFDKKVLLVERSELLGGAGINTGTIPSKTLRESALLLSGWRTRKLLGLDVSVRSEAKLADFTHHEKCVTSAERALLRSRLLEQRVDTMCGQAKLVGPQSVCVTSADGAQRVVDGRNLLIATGSAPVRPPEFPFEHPRIHDSNEILDIVEIPKVLAVVGAGIIGAEYACTFAALGVAVHLVDGRDGLFPFLDEEISASLCRAMMDAGIQFHWKERVTKCEVRGSDDIRLTLSSGAELAPTDVLVAAGRSSNTSDLNLSAAGLTCGERGLLKVDRHYQTDVPRIYAAGDVIGPPALAGTSMEQARVAVCHAFDVVNKRSSQLLPTGIYTIPEVSTIGETERSLKEKKIDYIVGRADYSQNARGRIIGDEVGFLKLLFRRDDMLLLGVHVIGEQATEIVHIGLVALHCGCGAEFFSYACFNYPTLGEMYKHAAYDAMLKRRSANPSVRHADPASTPGNAPR